MAQEDGPTNERVGDKELVSALETLETTIRNVKESQPKMNNFETRLKLAELIKRSNQRIEELVEERRRMGF